MVAEKEPNNKISRNNLRDAILHEYPLKEGDGEEFKESELLLALTQSAVNDLSEESILDYLAQKFPTRYPGKDHRGVIAFLDDCCTEVLIHVVRSGLFRSQLRAATACLIRIALTEGLIEVSRGHPVMQVIDQMIAMVLGLSQLQDRQRGPIENEIKDTLSQLSLITLSPIENSALRKSRDDILGKLSLHLEKLLEKERNRIIRVEERLAATETGLIKSNRTKNLASLMLNEKMQAVPLPQPINAFLQGPWNDSLQLLLARHGLESEIWSRAKQLTDTLIWTVQEHDELIVQAPGVIGAEVQSDLAEGTEGTVQHTSPGRAVFTPDMSIPDDIDIESIDLGDTESGDGSSTTTDGSFDANARTKIEIGTERIDLQALKAANTAAGDEGSQLRQKLYRIIENLPGELEQLLVSLQYRVEDTAAVLAEIESTHINIVTGQPIERVQADLLPCDRELLGAKTSISQVLMAEVSRIKTGQWFSVTTTGTEPTHLKLTLKMDDVQQLMFTNRMGIKILQKSFEEFAYLLSSGAVTALPADSMFSSKVRTELNRMVTAYLERKRAAAQSIKEEREKGQAKISRIKAMVEANLHHRAENGTNDAAVKAEPEHQISEGDRKRAISYVDGLQVGAWVELRTPLGQIEEGKLAVHVPARDRYIFVDRTGIKLGELSREQLIDRIARRECRVINSGIGFEDTLEKVVSNLRQNRYLEDGNG